MKTLVAMGVAGLVLTFVFKMNPINQESYILMADRRIGSPAMFIISAIAGCIMVWAVARLIDMFPSPMSMLQFVGKNSLLILCLHKPVIWELEQMFKRIPLYPPIELIITTVITAGVSCVLAGLINLLAPSLAGRQ